MSAASDVEAQAVATRLPQKGRILRDFATELLIAMSIAAAGVIVATWLSSVVPTPPTLTPRGDRTLVDPHWASAMGFLSPLLIISLLVRWLPRSGLMVPRHPPMSRRERSVWLSFVGLATITTPWADTITWLGTGIETDAWDQFFLSAVMTWLALGWLATAARPGPAPEEA